MVMYVSRQQRYYKLQLRRIGRYVVLGSGTACCRACSFSMQSVAYCGGIAQHLLIGDWAMDAGAIPTVVECFQLWGLEHAFILSDEYCEAATLSDFTDSMAARGSLQALAVL